MRQVHLDKINVFKDAGNFIGPFDQHDRVGVTQIVKAQHFKLSVAFDTIGVYMIDFKASGFAVVFVDYNKGRTVDPPSLCRAGTGGYSLYQMCLTGAESTDKRDDFTAFEGYTDFTAELNCLGDRICCDLKVFTNGRNPSAAIC